MKETANLLEKESECNKGNDSGNAKTKDVADLAEAESEDQADNTRTKPVMMEGGDSKEWGSGEGKGPYTRVSTIEAEGQGVTPPAAANGTAGSVTLSGDGVQQQQQQQQHNQNEQEQRQPLKPAVVSSGLTATGVNFSGDYVQQQQPQQQQQHHQQKHKMARAGKLRKFILSYDSTCLHKTLFFFKSAQNVQNVIISFLFFLTRCEVQNVCARIKKSLYWFWQHQINRLTNIYLGFSNVVCD